MPGITMKIEYDQQADAIYIRAVSKPKCNTGLNLHILVTAIFNEDFSGRSETQCFSGAGVQAPSRVKSRWSWWVLKHYRKVAFATPKKKALRGLFFALQF